VANRTVSVKLQADTAGFIAGLRSTSMATKQWAKEIADAEGKQRATFDAAGRGLMAMGTAALAGVGMATKAAIEWESAFAGVAKTVDGTAGQMAELEGQLRDLATSLPASHEQIAAVAEAAGQLGIARDDVVDFTKTAIALGETTNLSAEEAATAIARLANVMGSAISDVDRYGSTIVDLGNKSATTESEIIEMAQRIAGAGNQIGMAESDVLGLSAALSSVGINAEAGGSSISTAMIKIATAVNEGGDALDGFAEVAGMSSAQFTKLFKEDAAEALTLFVEGLGRMQQSGEDVFAVLRDLGLSEIRTRDAMLRLAGAGDLLRESLDTGAQAWRENTALTNEAEKRYATTASKIQVAWNSIKDVAIDVGAAIAPLFGLLADGAALVGDAFNLIPGPLKSALGLLGGFAGVAAVAGGAFLLFAPRIVETSRALRELDIRGRLASGRLGSLTRGALKVSGAFAALSVIGSIVDSAFGGPVQVKMDHFSDSLARWGETGKLAGEAARVFGDDLGDLKDSMDLITTGGFVGFINDVDRAVGHLIGSTDDLDLAEERFAAIDDTLAQLASSGDGDKAAKIFDRLAKLAKEQDISIAELLEHLPQYRAELSAMAGVVFDAEPGKTGWEHAAMSAEELEKRATKSLQKVGKKAEETGVQVSDATDQIALRFNIVGQNSEENAENVQKMFDKWRDAYAEFVPIADAYEQALEEKMAKEREAAEATARATKDSSDSWEDYIGDVELTVDEYMAQLERMAKEQEQWAENLLKLSGRVPDEMMAHLIELGPKGAGVVAKMTEMTEPELDKFIGLYNKTSGEIAEQFPQNIAEAGPVLQEIADNLGQKTADKIAEGMAKNRTDVYTEAKKHGVLIDRGVRVNERRILKFDVDSRAALAKAGYTKDEIERLLNGIQDEDVEVRLKARADKAAIKRLQGQLNAYQNADGNIWGGRENHVAQIAPAGAWRIWAEDETGGEAYIPLAPSKRARSLAILEQVAHMFGRRVEPYATGGVNIKMKGRASGFKETRADLREAMQAYGQSVFDTMVKLGLLFFGGFHPGLTGALAFVRSQVGKPYVWGGVGPGGYDCSGLISAAVNVALGRNPHRRIGSTATMPWSMFAPGPGAFTIGWFKGNPGHTAGTINGVNIESRGGDGVVMGRNARGANSGLFTNRAHLKGFADGGIEGDPPFDLLSPMGKYYGRGFRYGGVVPWDGLYAMHRGEVVQTPDFMRLQAQQSAVSSAPIRLHPQDLHEIKRAMNLVVNMDGRRVAQITSKHNGLRADLISRGG